MVMGYIVMKQKRALSGKRKGPVRGEVYVQGRTEGRNKKTI